MGVAQVGAAVRVRREPDALECILGRRWESVPQTWEKCADMARKERNVINNIFFFLTFNCSDSHSQKDLLTPMSSAFPWLNMRVKRGLRRGRP